LLFFAALVFLAPSCTEAAPFAGIRAAQVASGLDKPVFAAAPSGDSRLFIVEQTGRIRIVKDGTLLSSPFLDISARISSGGERGLLGLAFHPRYGANGYFFLNYTDRAGDTRIVRFGTSAEADRADPDSGKPILSVDQPYANHNGGMLLFGPDGMLYIGMGDGGSGGDPQGNGQNKGTLLGKLLRIDVDSGDPYAIPAGNPFTGASGQRAEIWATGLRNPWRFAFDPVSGLLFIADVGQNAWEEINAVPATAAGLNYGWKTMEGNHFYPSGSGSTRGLTLPVLEYSHSEGCSVTGGFVYRGASIPEIAGHYFYADYCSGWVRSFRMGTGGTGAPGILDARVWELGNLGRILSFGQDAAGELYILSDNGKVYRIERAR
jgi:glucose/arabinose dehydrogenase